jgi:hypothetical protein
VDAVAIEAIQHAPDPSAVATAFANGIALDRSDPKLYAAYVARMVDFGLPGSAYRQAQALTTLQPGNGLALGVIAYMDARRGRMADAITDINLAGQFAPENRFVAHTAGELLAWYDVRADQTTLTEKARQGVARIRALLAKQVAFTGAYETACKAYRAQPKAEAPPALAAPGQSAPVAQARRAPPVPAPQPALQGGLIAAPGYAAPVVAPPYYPYPDYADSYYDWAPDFGDVWGPGWIAIAPGSALTSADIRSHRRTGAGERGWTSATRPGGTGRIYYDFNYAAPPTAAPSAGGFAAYREVPLYNGPLYSAPREAPPGRESVTQNRQAPAFGGFQAPAFGGYQAPAFESHGGNREDSLEGGASAGDSGGGFHRDQGSFGRGGHRGGGHR